MTQETINTVVTMDTIAGLVVFGALAIFGLYKLIDYLWFCHKARRDDHDGFGNPLK